MASVPVKLDEIVNQLEQLIKDSSNGTIFIVTDQNHMSRITVHQGRIVGLRYRNTNGFDALEQMTSIQTGRVNFVSNKVTVPKVDDMLPPTETILDVLRGAGIDNISNPAASQAAAPSADLKEIISIICEELVKDLGPMAAMICEEYTESARDVTDIINSLDGLATEIDDPAAARKFKQTVLQKIDHFT